jgi:hypothetical protein
MKICHSLLAAVFLAALVAPGQDWQDCKTDTSYQVAGPVESFLVRASVAILQTLNDSEMYSFKEVQVSVHRVTTSRMYTDLSKNAGVCALDSSRGLRLPQPLR